MSKWWRKKKPVVNDAETRLKKIYELFHLYDIKTSVALDGSTGGPGQIFESKLHKLLILAIKDFGMHLIAFGCASTSKFEDALLSRIIYYGMTNEQGEAWLMEVMKAVREMIAGDTERVMF